MTPRQSEEAATIVRELRLQENADGIFLHAPEDLAYKFREFLEVNGVDSGIALGVLKTDKLSFSQVTPKRVEAERVQELLEEFSRERALDPADDVAGYWGGILPPDIRISYDEE